MDVDLFSKLIDDKSDSGCYCSDAELLDMHQMLAKKVEPSKQAPPENAELQPTDTKVNQAKEPLSRSAMIQQIFRALDADCDKHLCASEMHVFACHTGFDGTQDDWKVE